MEPLVVLIFLMLLIGIFVRLGRRGGAKGLLTTKCQHCRQIIPDKASVCSFCGRDVRAKKWIWQR